VLDRVADEVGKHLLEPGAVPAQGGRAAGVNREGAVRVDQPGVFDDVLGQGREVEFLEGERPLPVQPGKQ
jgi:hypothetical protein